MIEIAQACAVREVAGLDAAGLRAAIAAGEPVRIPKLAEDWPALSRWRADHLLELALRSPGVEVPVRRTPRDRLELDAVDVHAGRMELARFMTQALLTGDDDELYMAGVTIADFAPFAEEFQRPALLAEVPAVGPSLFAGRNTRCLGHYHARTQALLVQVCGRKQVLLYPPEASGALGLVPAHSEGFWRSRINFHAADELQASLCERFPGLRRGRPQVTWLEPGDALFIPVHWLHVPWGPGWSVSLTWWWRAALREWSFPSPGLRTAVGVSVEYARRRLGRLAGAEQP